ncbi:MAG: hypothetical protein J6P72_01240, partial [Firmicutes bacterium]|nr:hypothetical protein [Bacillota bacterium]
MPEQLYRESLKEKLLDLAGELKTGRGSFSVGSGRYRSLDNAISSVVKLLDQHEHEEVLSQEDRVKLETEIQKMKKAALNYRNYKLSQVALSDRGVATASVEQRIRVDRIRYQAADDILKIDTKIPKNPGEEQGIVPPDQLEPGDRPQTDWRLKWKQNTRYLAKKQLKAFEHKLAAFNAGKDPEQLKPDQEDFDLLMDMVGKQILAYKNDAHLCKKYPKMRLDMERAIRTSEKLKNLTEDEFATYIFNWLSNSTKKAVAAAKRAKNRKGLPFTEADEEKAVKDHEEIIQEKIANFGTQEKLETAGDVLTQMARFADLKMQMISDKQYVQLMHTNKLGHTFDVVDYERLIKTSKTKEEKKFYRILRDIRELEDAGIKHIKPAYAIEKAVYKKITETDHRTFKRDFFNFTSTRVGAKATTVKHTMKNLPSIEGNTSAMAIDQNNKFRVGKIGLQLHSKHKSVQVSGGVAFGQARVSTTIGTCLSKPGAQLSLLADATAVRARIKTKASMFKGDVKASLGAGVNVGYASALFSGGIGNITVKDAEGNEKTAFGVSGKVGAVAAIAKGDVGCTFNFFGFKISASLTGYGGAIGTEYGGELTTGGASLTLGGALGIGAT